MNSQLHRCDNVSNKLFLFCSRYVHTILTYDAHWCAPLTQTRTRRRVSKFFSMNFLSISFFELRLSKRRFHIYPLLNVIVVALTKIWTSELNDVAKLFPIVKLAKFGTSHLTPNREEYCREIFLRFAWHFTRKRRAKTRSFLCFRNTL